VCVCVCARARARAKKGCDKYGYIKYPLTKQHQSSKICFSYYAFGFIRLFTTESAFRMSS